MKKILSKVLIAVSIFNGVNVSACAMEEKPVNPQTGVSNSWKAYDKKKKKRINDVLFWMMGCIADNTITTWDWYESYDLDSLVDRQTKIDTYIAKRCTACASPPLDSDKDVYAIARSLDKYWDPIDGYDGFLQSMSSCYAMYGRGVCRDKSVWAVGILRRNNIYARLLLVGTNSSEQLAKEVNADKSKVMDHAVVLYGIPNEIDCKKLDYYIADPECFSGLCKVVISDYFQSRGRSKITPNEYWQFLNNDYYIKSQDMGKETNNGVLGYMQCPLSTYLNSRNLWNGNGFVIDKKIVCPWMTTRDNLRALANIVTGVGQGKASKEDASKVGIIDLTMWCQKNCPEVLK